MNTCDKCGSKLCSLYNFWKHGREMFRDKFKDNPDFIYGDKLIAAVNEVTNLNRFEIII